MVTEGARTVLLVVSMAVVASSRSTRTVLDTAICNETPYGIEREFIYCYMDYSVQMPSYMQDFGRHNALTKDKLFVALNDQCTEAVTAGLSCFFDRIRGCNASFIAHMNRLENTGVGFICQPGGVGIEPAMSYVLDSITDDDLTLYMMRGPCRMRHSSCYGAFGLQNERDKLPLDDLVSLIQRATESFVRCNAADYEAVKQTCPYWRADLLMQVVPLMSHPFLGLHLPFTQQQLADMFEL